MKTSDLIGPALDWAVAKCEGWRADPEETMHKVFSGLLYPPEAFEPDEGGNLPNLGYHCYTNVRNLGFSTDWSNGGLIIDRERITWTGQSATLCRLVDGKYQTWEEFGPTALVAAMRAYVASKLGPEVEIPEELKNGG